MIVEQILSTWAGWIGWAALGVAGIVVGAVKEHRGPR